MKFLLAAPGSRGDFQPMLALARGLRAAGHEATVAARPLYAPDAAAFEVPFVPLGQNADEFLRTRAGPHAIQAFLAQELEAQLDTLPALAAGADLVLGAGMAFAVRSVAEAAGVASLSVAYAPGLFMPSGRRSILLPEPLLQTLRAFHSKHGLPDVENLLAYAFAPERVLLAADAELVGPLGGVTLWAPPTGALLLDDPRPLDAGLEAFLAAGAPPVYIGFGSLTGSAPGLDERLLREAASAAGCRALLFTGTEPPGRQAPDGQVFRIGHTSHAQLFARVAAVVHHGGAGTLAAAARAGVPQVVVPHAYDQPFWAERAHRLGIAPAPVPARGVNAPALRAALRHALESPSIQAQARALATTLASRNGLETVVKGLTRPPG